MAETEVIDRPSHGAEYAAGVDLAAAKRERGRDIRPLRRLLPYLARRRGDAIGAIVFLLASTLATVALPLAFRDVIDRGFVAGAADAVDQAFLGLGAVALLMAITSAARFYFVSKIGERVVTDLRADVYDHLLSLSPGYFARVRTGEVLSRLTVDAALIETLIGSSASMATRAVLTLSAAIVMLVVTNAQLAGLLVLVLPAVMAPILLFGRRVRTLSMAAQDRVADAQPQPPKASTPSTPSRPSAARTTCVRASATRWRTPSPPRAAASWRARNSPPAPSP